MDIPSSHDVREETEVVEEDEDDEGVIEHDPSDRYQRYDDIIGKSRFKVVYKGFDSAKGMDVAWSKINIQQSALTEEHVENIISEMRKGLHFDHANVIKVYKVWLDERNCEINFVSELFTSGSLRQYRRQHPRLEKKALVKFAKQTLKGLKYLHSLEAPVIHGNLRCDKIYVNGNKGEIKIGDLGLSAFVPTMHGDQLGVIPETDYSTDIMGFGLCMLELTTMQPQDLSNIERAAELIDSVEKEDIKDLILRCLGSRIPGNADEVCPTAEQLLQSPIFRLDSQQKNQQQQQQQEGGFGDTVILGRHNSGTNGTEDIDFVQQHGEDYEFYFKATVAGEELYFEITITPIAVVTEEDEEERDRRRITFMYSPESDDADQLARELGESCKLSETDTQICAAALKGWIAKLLPGQEE